jgi:hypothetical protein
MQVRPSATHRLKTLFAWSAIPQPQTAINT